MFVQVTNDDGLIVVCTNVVSSAPPIATEAGVRKPTVPAGMLVRRHDTLVVTLH